MIGVSNGAIFFDLWNIHGTLNSSGYFNIQEMWCTKFMKMALRTIHQRAQYVELYHENQRLWFTNRKSESTIVRIFKNVKITVC